MFTIVFHDLLEKNLNERKDQVAIIDRYKSYTYDEIYLKVEKLASWMYKRGVRKGDRVGIYLYKSIEEIVAMFAASRIGAVFVNINYQWTVKQFDYVVSDCQIKFAVIDERRCKEILETNIPEYLQTILVKGKAPKEDRFFSWESLPPLLLPEKFACIDLDLAAILYTSGSTGRPKGVMLSSLNIIQGARSVAKYLNNNSTDRVISVLPFSFDYGLSQLTTMFLVGGSVLLQPIQMPSEIIRSIKEYNVTGFASVPPTWISIVRYLQETKANLPSLRYITNSGGKIPKNILKAMQNVFPEVAIYLMYGLTESFRSTYLPPEMFEKKMGSIGRSIPNAETFIINNNGDGICGPGEEGELVHRGVLVSKGYWGKEDATNEKIKVCPALKKIIGDEKVVYSGDIIKIDEDGYYWFVSRIDSLIKCTGFRISPQEVEEIVLMLENILEAVAFGEEDEAFGQIVHVVLSTIDDTDLDKEKILKHCKKNMPHYMIPKVIHQFNGKMPKTASGKIDVPMVVSMFKGKRQIEINY